MKPPIKPAESVTTMPKKEFFDCKLCTAQFTGFSQKRWYVRHIETCHFNTVEGIEILSCNDCPFKTGSSWAMKVHVTRDGKYCTPDKKFKKVTKFQKRLNFRISFQ